MESLTLRWSPPTEIAEASEIEQFTIEYAAMDENATKTVDGSAKQLYITNPNEHEVLITNLTPGALYTFSSKVSNINTIITESYSLDLYHWG